MDHYDRFAYEKIFNFVNKSKNSNQKNLDLEDHRLSQLNLEDLRVVRGVQKIIKRDGKQKNEIYPSLTKPKQIKEIIHELLDTKEYSKFFS